MLDLIACEVHHSSWRWLELCFHVWILLFFGLFCLFFLGSWFSNQLSIPINNSLSSLFKGTSIGVYTLGFGLVLFCIRGGSNINMPGNDIFPPVYVMSVCITWPVSQLLASYFLFLYNYCWWNIIKMLLQKLVKHLFQVKSMHIVSFLGVYSKGSSLILVF